VDELYEKARNERELVIYGGGPAPRRPWTTVPARELERQLSGIKVTIESGFSNVLDAETLTGPAR
jgi:hypothetical protein